MKPRKPYTRGSFRAIKNVFGFGYLVQVRRRQTRKDAEYWMDFEQFDYLSNARCRVRNLHAACCTLEPFTVTCVSVETRKPS